MPLYEPIIKDILKNLEPIKVGALKERVKTELRNKGYEGGTVGLVDVNTYPIILRMLGEDKIATMCDDTTCDKHFGVPEYFPVCDDCEIYPLKIKETANVLINVKLENYEQNIKETLNFLRKTKNVDKAHMVRNALYEGLAIVSADNMDELKETVTWDIRRFDKISSTLTMIVETDEDGPIGFKKDPQTGELTYCHPTLR